MKKLGVIILNWNGLELLKRFLPGASLHTVCDEVDLIVADNGSTDGSVEWICRNHPEVGVIRLPENYGFAEGYNRAIAQIDYPFVTLLNSDVEVTGGWWQPILRFMESDEAIGAVQPKIRSLRRREMFEHAGAAGGYLDNLGYPYCRGRLFDRVEKDDGQYDGPPAEVAWASGACLTVRTDVYRKVGGLDPEFFAHMEEIDLCVRIRFAGYRVCAITDSHVFHLGAATLRKGDPKKTYLNFRNNLLLLHKNMPRKAGQKMLLRRRLADSLAFMMFAVKFEFANARAVLKAHRDFRRMRVSYTQLPDKNLYKTLPGTHRSALRARWIPGGRKQGFRTESGTRNEAGGKGE